MSWPLGDEYFCSEPALLDEGGGLLCPYTRDISTSTRAGYRVDDDVDLNRSFQGAATFSASRTR